MAKVHRVTKEDGIEKQGYDYVFLCPGCGTYHGFWTTGNVTWDFNGDMNNPTIQPSILRKSGYMGKYVCHSFITGGMIQYLSDCTHKLAGVTVELPEV